mgnify:CR=1 FL=1
MTILEDPEVATKSKLNIDLRGGEILLTDDGGKGGGNDVRDARVARTRQVGALQVRALKLHPLHVQAVEDRALGRQGGQVQTRDRLQGPQIDAVEDRGLTLDPAGLAPAGVFAQHFRRRHAIDRGAGGPVVGQGSFHIDDRQIIFLENGSDVLEEIVGTV